MKAITSNQSKPKRAIAYARVASRQIPVNESCIQKQLDEIKAYATANNIEIVGEFYDVNKSAQNAKRPGLQGLLNFATVENERIDYVIVQSISRLSRNTQSCCVDILGKLEPLGIHIRSATEDFDETPRGQFRQMMSLALAQISTEKYHKRTMLKSQTTD